MRNEGQKWPDRRKNVEDQPLNWLHSFECAFRFRYVSKCANVFQLKTFYKMLENEKGVVSEPKIIQGNVNVKCLFRGCLMGSVRTNSGSGFMNRVHSSSSSSGISSRSNRHEAEATAAHPCCCNITIDRRAVRTYIPDRRFRGFVISAVSNS